MQKNIAVILSFCILLIATACEKEVKNIKIPQETSKMVVTAFISPQDTVLRANVVKTYPSIGKVQLSSDNIKDASITIADEEISIPMIYNESERSYIADIKKLPVLAGKTYFLQVNHPDYPRVEASCTVPLTQNNSLEVVIDSVDSKYGSFKEYFMLMKWQDTPGEINYYRVSGEILSDQDDGYHYYQSIHFDANDMFSDTRLDGARFSSPKGPIYINIISPGGQTKNNTLFAYLLNTDEPYFRYHQSLRNFNTTDGNPFAEPVLIYSNITGGLGVFAAYNRTTVQIQIN